MVHNIGVGDVFIAAGQSNAAGRAKNPVEDPPELGVHLLRPSGRWDLATHPMGETTDAIHLGHFENQDEHTAALDPKTAAKVLEATEKIVSKDHLTTLMITHNMRDAIAHGNRLIMMYEGRIVVDVSGEDKKKLTVEQLLALFSTASGSDEADDKLLLS